VQVFKQHEDILSTINLSKGLTRDQVLSHLRDDLVGLGFATVMGEVDTLARAVSNTYKYKTGERKVESNDYDNTVATLRSRLRLPYKLIVIGY